MSVLVKGIQMPKDCFSCPLKEEGFCNITNAYAGQIYERNSDCPLVEVPTPHGRLVEFIDVVVTDDEDTGTQEIKLGEALSAYLKMRSAPAIIEAEGKDED